MKEVSAAIIIEDGKILLTKRNSSGDLSGYWEFPGGKRENNETIFECLEREIKEELNVSCKALNIFAENIYEYENGTIKLIAIIAKLFSRNIILSVHDEYIWTEMSNLLNYKLAPADTRIAKLLLEEHKMDYKVIESIIWDWNGTILNDVDNNINAVNMILQKRNLRVISKEEYRRKIKIPIKQFYNDIGLETNDPETYNLIANDYWEYYNMGYKNNAKINNGIEDILNKLKGDGISNYLLSATQHEELIKQVKDKGMETYFKDIIGNNNYEVKNKLEKAKELIKNDDIKVNNTILIGDMINDYELAEELGIKCILYSNGHQEIKMEKGKNIINNFEKIYNYIKLH